MILSLLIPSRIYAEDAHHALELYDRGVSLYKSGDYRSAERAFIESLRYTQESRCLYYKALAISKQDQRPCGEKLVAWQSYLTLCERMSACEESWKKKAIENNQKFSASCEGCSHVQGECPVTEKQKQKQKQKQNQNQNQNQNKDTLKSKDQSKAQTSSDKKKTKKNKDTEDAMEIEASLLCRIRNERGSYETLKVCHGEYFREDDQIALRVRPTQEGYLYVLIYNDKGQAQLAWPGPGDNPLLRAQTTYALPSPEDSFYKGWWSVDHVKDTKEVISLIFSRTPLEDLERMRGLNLSPELSRALAQRDPARARSVKQWTTIAGEQVQDDAIVETVAGDAQRVVAQFYFLHE